MVEHLIELPDEAATLALGAALAPGAGHGLVLHLQGELGAGKTTVVRGLLRALGWPGRVKSPTFPLLEHYAVSRLDLYHFDFYRFEDPAEWLNSGFREYFGERSLCIVEWPERAGPRLPAADLLLELAIQGSGRRARSTGRSAAGAAWLGATRSYWERA